MNKVMQLRLVAAAAVIAAIAAGAGNAASFGRTDKPPYPPYPNATFKHPQLKHGVLSINGTKASDKITLRLKAGDPGVLEVDVGDDGVPDFSFSRASVTRIAVNAGRGNDAIRIDDTNGAFTDVIPTTIGGGAGNDTITGGKEPKPCCGPGNDTIDGNGGNDAARLGAGADTFVWDPGDGSDTIKVRRVRTRCASTARTASSTSLCPRTGSGSSSSATRATSRWTPRAWSESTSMHSAVPTS